MGKVLAVEKVTNCLNHQEYLGQLCILGKKHLPRLQELDERICQGLERPDLFARFTEKEWSEILGRQGLVIGLEADGRLWGYSGILYPGLREDNLGRDLGLSEEELPRVAHLETVAIDPALRGNDLARKIGYLLIDTAQKRRGWQYLLNTTSPYNYPSIRSTFSMHMQVVALTVKYGNKIRYIACREKNAAPAAPQNPLWVDTKDLPRQKELLAQGCRGYAIRQKEDGLQMAYLYLPNKSI